MPAHLPAIEGLIEQFKAMPGIGRKAAERLAYHVLSMPKTQATKLAGAIRELRSGVHICSTCFSLAEDESCPVCQDTRRETGIICVVERARDVIQIEKTGAYRGIYHVLQGRLSAFA